MTIPDDPYFREVPRRIPDKSKWPAGVRTISMAEADALGIDAKGELYWHGKPVEIRRPIDLTTGQRMGAFVVGFFVVIGSIGAVAQGWSAYNDWACKVGWWAVCAAPAANPPPRG